MNCYGLNRFGPIEKKERPQNLQEKKEIEEKLAVLLADRQKQDSIWITPGFTTPGLTNPGFTNPGLTNPGFTNPDEKSKLQTASFFKKAEATSK
jgi:hypothetical protein